LLSAHPWRLPILLVLAFAATVAIAAAVLREKRQTTPAQVSQSRKR
jgi:anti-sigma-K factor RskA